MGAEARALGANKRAAADGRAENTAEGQKELRAALLAKATALVPLLRAKAAETERDRRIPDEILAAIDAAQLFRLRTPKRFGGFEGDLRTYMDVVTELGRGCGSTSWVAFISIATVRIAALFPEEAQREVFEGHPDVRFMGALGMTARARAADGGYVVDGKWAYASNCLHAHWAVLSAPLPNGGAITPSIMLVPMRDLTIEDTWHVVGMRGTGSQTVVAREVFVPAHRALPTEALAKGLSPRTNRQEFVYREAFAPTAIIAVAAPVLGMAQAALELTLERISKGKPIAYSFYDDTRKAPSMQLELAQAATLVESAVLQVRRWCDDIADAAAHRQGAAVHQTRADAHGFGLRHALLPRGGRSPAQCARGLGLRRIEPDAAHLARSRNGEPPWLVGRRNPARDLRPRAGRQFRAAVADGIRGTIGKVSAACCRRRTSMADNAFQARLERLLDRTEIFDLVRFERLCRDQRDFAGMVGCYVANAPVRTTWFEGTVEDFAEASRKKMTFGQPGQALDHAGAARNQGRTRAGRSRRRVSSTGSRSTASSSTPSSIAASSRA